CSTTVLLGEAEGRLEGVGVKSAAIVDLLDVSRRLQILVRYRIGAAPSPAPAENPTTRKKFRAAKWSQLAWETRPFEPDTRPLLVLFCRGWSSPWVVRGAAVCVWQKACVGSWRRLPFKSEWEQSRRGPRGDRWHAGSPLGFLPTPCRQPVGNGINASA